MTDSEANDFKDRLARYQALKTLQGEIYAALRSVKEPSDGTNPFTGNTQESRKIDAIRLWFTQTRGGASAVELIISNPHIEAYELGRALESMLQAKLKQVSIEMEKI